LNYNTGEIEMIIPHNENLILNKIEVYGLFGIYDYPDIQFKISEGITIIYGINGSGKTTILKLISLTMKSDFSSIAEIHFKKIIFHFLPSSSLDSREEIYLYIEKKQNNEIFEFNIGQQNDESNSVKVLMPLNNREFVDNIKSFWNFLRLSKKAKNKDYYYSTKEINKKLRRLKKLKPDQSLLSLFDDESIDEIISLKESDNWTDPLEIEELKNLKQLNMIRKVLSDISKRFKCNLITAQRLDIRNYSKGQKKKIRNVITIKSESLISKIDDKLKDYTKTSQTQDKKLIFGIINAIEEPNNLDFKEIYDEFEKLEHIQEEYMESGLDTSEESGKVNLRASLEKSQNWKNEEQKQILYRILKKVNIDRWEKLEIFSNLNLKIALFTKIINSHLNKKRLEINHKKGFIIKQSETEQNIPLDLLSSGEKHIIILFYWLIFETENDSLVMIDEPEISLHVEWQLNFISNLMAIKNSKVKELNNLRFIIATHSPQIVHDRRDLMVELED